MEATEAQRKSLIIGVHVISVTCPCGGMCENENGSTMIEYMNNVVWCLDCGQRYKISDDPFKKFQHSVEA